MSVKCMFQCFLSGYMQEHYLEKCLNLRNKFSFRSSNVHVTAKIFSKISYSYGSRLTSTDNSSASSSVLIKSLFSSSKKYKKHNESFALKSNKSLSSSAIDLSITSTLGNKLFKLAKSKMIENSCSSVSRSSIKAAKKVKQKVVNKSLSELISTSSQSMSQYLSV